MNEDNNAPIGVNKWYDVYYFAFAQIRNSVIDNIRMCQYPIQRKLKLINYSGNKEPWVFVDEQEALTILSYSQIACVIPIKEGNKE